MPVAIRHPGEAPDSIERFDEETAVRGSLGLMEDDAFIRRVLSAGT